MTLNMRADVIDERLTDTHLTLMTAGKIETVGMVSAHIRLTLTTQVSITDWNQLILPRLHHGSLRQCGDIPVGSYIGIPRQC